MKRLLKGTISFIVVAAVLLLSASLVFGEAPVIYVSGAPDSYPMEYYHVGEKTYKGYIPALLSAFGEEYGYTIEYLDTEGADRRESHYKNAQADIISAVTGGFSAEEREGGIVVFHSDKEYRLLFTDSASETLKGQLTEFCEGLTDARANTILLGAIGERPFEITPLMIVISAVVTLGLIAAFVILSVSLKRSRALIAPKSETVDILTGVGNYQYFRGFFKQSVTPEARSLYSAVYFGAHLKNGREDQSALLKLMATILGDKVGKTDGLARIDDGFLVMRHNYGNDPIDAWTEDTVQLLRAAVKGGTAFASAMIHAGVYNLGAHDGDPDKILSDTAYCCRFAEKSDATFTVYSKEIEKAEQEEAKLRVDLKDALNRDEFIVYLQFIVNSETKKILGAEALSRWEHPSFGLLSPGRYIDILESEKLYHLLDFVILRKVCEALQEFCHATEKEFFIACNFSRNTINMPDFAEQVSRVVGEYDFPRDRLRIEVTEYGQLEDTKTLFDNVRKIKEMGIKVVIDDFGNGFSDLLDIGKAKFDGVKFDRALIAGDHTETDDIVLKSLIDLMHNLGMTVIAEGIENEEQSERLRKAGCNLNQGFCYYLPMPRSEALRIFLNEE